MKRLSRIKLQNAVILENHEMKSIFGGSGASGTIGGCKGSYGSCSGACTKSDGKSGTCKIRQAETMCRCL